MKFAIFDLDGTIVDSMGYWRGFAQAFLREKGCRPDEEIEQINSVKWVEKICELFERKYGLSVTPDRLRAWGIEYVMDRYANKIDFKPGARRLLEKLKSMGVKMCICSSTDRYMMEPVIKKLDLDKYFIFTQHCRRFGKEKDQPDIFFDCMQRLGAQSPRQVAVFEDALYSASTAKKAGFYLVGMYDKTEKNTDKLEEIADQYVTDYSRLDYRLLPE